MIYKGFCFIICFLLFLSNLNSNEDLLDFYLTTKELKSKYDNLKMIEVNRKRYDYITKNLTEYYFYNEDGFLITHIYFNDADNYMSRKIIEYKNNSNNKEIIICKCSLIKDNNIFNDDLIISESKYKKCFSVLFDEDKLRVTNSGFEKIISKKNDTIVIREYDEYLLFFEELRFIHYYDKNGRILQIYNKSTDEVHTNYVYKGDTTLIEYLYPMDPLYGDFKSNEMIVSDSTNGIIKHFDIINREYKLKEVLYLNEQKRDSIRYFTNKFHEDGKYSFVSREKYQYVYYKNE